MLSRKTCARRRQRVFLLGVAGFDEVAGVRSVLGMDGWIGERGVLLGMDGKSNGVKGARESQPYIRCHSSIVVGGQFSGIGSVSLPVRPHVTVRGRRTKTRRSLTSWGTLSGTSSARNSAVDSTRSSRGHAVVMNATKSAFAFQTTSRRTPSKQQLRGISPRGHSGKKDVLGRPKTLLILSVSGAEGRPGPSR
ncbi:hypothetical protein C8R47DRAFT_421674 [Mycena vitilis]|nr:hypothetical protein C8R47DRAFT_421674 [Mycena vitilis]